MLGGWDLGLSPALHGATSAPSARPSLMPSLALQGRLLQTKKSGYFPSSSVKPCPVDARVSAREEMELGLPTAGVVPVTFPSFSSRPQSFPAPSAKPLPHRGGGSLMPWCRYRAGQSQPCSQGWDRHHQIQLCAFSDSGARVLEMRPSTGKLQLVYFNCP